MQISLRTNYKNIYDKQLHEIYIKNYYNDREFTPDYRYSCIYRWGDIWFHLINQNDEIIAMCSIAIDKNTNIYEIHDVYVEEKFRGNNYATLLLVNVLNELIIINPKPTIIIKASIDNHPAFQTYKKVFGNPISIENKKAKFVG